MGEIIRGLFKQQSSQSFRCGAVIAAGGTGQRMGLSFNKLFLTVDERPILAYTLDVFEETDCIDEVVIVCNEQDVVLCHEVVQDFGYTKIKTIVTGGPTRQQSVYKGLKELSEEIQVVVIHDAARPLVTPEIITETAAAAFADGAAAAGITPTDTVKIVQNNKIRDTLDRNSLVLIQTPQAFQKELIVGAHQSAAKSNILATDDCALLELMNQSITVVPGSSGNMKLTTPEDYLFISSYLTYRGDFE